jgi:hypothetical protein
MERVDTRMRGSSRALRSGRSCVLLVRGVPEKWSKGGFGNIRGRGTHRCLPSTGSKSPEALRHLDPAILTEPAGFHGIDHGVSSLRVNADLIPLPGNGHEITGLPSKMSQDAI